MRHLCRSARTNASRRDPWRRDRVIAAGFAARAESKRGAETSKSCAMSILSRVRDRTRFGRDRAPTGRVMSRSADSPRRQWRRRDSHVVAAAVARQPRRRRGVTATATSSPRRHRDRLVEAAASSRLPRRRRGGVATATSSPRRRRAGLVEAAASPRRSCRGCGVAATARRRGAAKGPRRSRPTPPRARASARSWVARSG